MTYAALNSLNVMACDIKSAYLQAPTSDKHYIVCGSEFGADEGRIALIKRALYGGKTAGTDYWRHMRSYMDHIGFTSCKGDPDVWMRPAQKDNGDDYYEYVCLYTDDALVISYDLEPVIRYQIGKYWQVKEESIGPPDIYLGNKVSKIELSTGQQCWSFSSSQYVKAAVNNVQQYLTQQGLSLPKRASSPLTPGYRPELDTTQELDPTQASYYMSLIGILRWVVELGRIAIEVSNDIFLMA